MADEEQTGLTATEPSVDGQTADGTFAVPTAPPETQVSSDEPPDYKALYEATLADKTKLESDLSTAKGRVSAREREEERLARLLKPLHDRMESLQRDLDYSLPDDVVQERTVERQRESDTRRAEMRGQRMSQEITEAGLSMDDERLGPALSYWNQGIKDGSVYDWNLLDAADAAVRDLLRDIREEEKESLVKKTEESVTQRMQAQNAEDGVLGMGTRNGSGGPSESDQRWLNRYGAGAEGGIPPTRENSERARKLLESGLVPQPIER